MNTQLDAEGIPAPTGLELPEVRKYAFATMERVVAAVTWLEGEPRAICRLQESANYSPEVRRQLIQRRRDAGAALREQMEITQELFKIRDFCLAQTARELHFGWLKPQMAQLRLILGCEDGALVDSMPPEEFGEQLAAHIFPHLVDDSAPTSSGLGGDSGAIDRGHRVGPKSYRLALRSFQYAEHVSGRSMSDTEAYAWLLENGIDCQQVDGFYELDSYKLRGIKTWHTYLSKGRRSAGESKNSPRAGRDGRSVVPASQL